MLHALTRTSLTNASAVRKTARNLSKSSPVVVLRATQQQSVFDVRVEEVMSNDPVILSPGDSVKQAIQTFLNKNITGAPVVDNEGRLVGFLSEADLVWKEVGVPDSHMIIPPIYIPFIDAMISLQDDKAFATEARKVLAKTVGEAMTNDVISVGPETPLADAAHTMLTKKIARMPVVEKGKVVGMICRRDILRAMLLEHNPYINE